MKRSINIATGFDRASAIHPNRIALHAGGRQVSYGALRAMVTGLAGWLGTTGSSRRVGILATRSAEAYVGILAAAWTGATYVPLNLKWPEARLVSLLRMLDLDALVVDANGAGLLTPAVLAAAPDRIVVADAAPPIQREGAEALIRLGDILATPMASPAVVDADHPAYIIFTSGSTGTPKGVVISCDSLRHYLEETRRWTQLTAEDRVAETCDVTFDLSVHNMFLTFEAGASLHVLSSLEMLAPGRFIRSRGCTVWMSVPTLIALMRGSGALKPGIFPSLRLSIFCGEPLPVGAAQAWAAAAPNGSVENIYGPTEGTVVCMRQTLTDPPVATPGRNIVAIGRPYDTMAVSILDDQLEGVPDGTPGEIALSGPQLAVGYFAAPEQTDRQFRTIRGKRWYLTGDLGMRDAAGVFHHLGRTDNQVKVKGNRIELEEVETHLRAAADSDLVAVAAWPVVNGSAQGLVAFVAGSEIAAADIQARMARVVQPTLVPARVDRLEELPVNINGKVDRRALFESLERQHASRSAESAA